MRPVSHTHDLTDADVSGKNVFHSRDIKLAKVPSLGSPYMSIGKICADLVSQSCFLYSPKHQYKIFCVNKHTTDTSPAWLLKRTAPALHSPDKTSLAILSYFSFIQLLEKEPSF